MTIPAFHVEARKACVRCGALFYKRDGEWPHKFRKRTHCSRSCANAGNQQRLPARERLSEPAILAAHVSFNHDSGCLEWIGAKNPDGYGTTSVKNYRGAHRLAYFVAFGPIPAGAHVLHRCDNPACVTPEHFFLGSHLDNAADKVAKNRQHRPSGASNPKAKLTPEQVRTILSSPESGAALGRRFGVSRGTVNDIRRGAKWRHLQAELLP